MNVRQCPISCDVLLQQGYCKAQNKTKKKSIFCRQTVQSLLEYLRVHFYSAVIFVAIVLLCFIAMRRRHACVLFIVKQGDKERRRERQRETERERVRETETETERQRDRETEILKRNFREDINSAEKVYSDSMNKI